MVLNGLMKTNKYTLFDWVKNIILYKKNWENYSEEEKKTWNSFMIHRLLSMNPKYIEVVNYIQGLNIHDNRKLYEIYCFMIPQSKNTYSAYIKSNTKKASPEVAQHVAEYFECSVSEADEYISLTDKKWLENILTAKGIDEKEIKKLIK